MYGTTLEHSVWQFPNTVIANNQKQTKKQKNKKKGETRHLYAKELSRTTLSQASATMREGEKEKPTPKIA